jgi:hypothetical protein
MPETKGHPMSESLDPRVFVTRHFAVKELACPCCGQLDRTEALKLAVALELVRTFTGPLTILSGTRCQHYNEQVGGVRGSAHLTSQAADLTCNSDAAMFELIRVAMHCGFRRIGIAARSVHLDVKGSTYPLLWTYYEGRR